MVDAYPEILHLCDVRVAVLTKSPLVFIGDHPLTRFCVSIRLESLVRNVNQFMHDIEYCLAFCLGKGKNVLHTIPSMAGAETEQPDMKHSIAPITEFSF